ncbi:MAG TPA: ABC transporter ATP-binding protein, partial [Bacteroidia bacterium]|nr:ABC transporter ATP-binding protein [Bacteroidia bacterium]
MISAKGIQKSFGKLQVLKGIDLEVKKGEVVSIVGTSGAGKTTLLHILGTLDRADQGSLEINNTQIHTLRDRELSRFRNRQIGFVFQFHYLLPEFTAIENVCIPGFIAKTPTNEVRKRAEELLTLLGLKERLEHKPSELSGGEQQRVAVARALINSPSVVFADEPSGNLDSANARDLHNLFFHLRDTLSQTFVIATHNEEL